MDTVRAVEAPVPCLLGEGRSILPSSSKAIWNCSVDSPVMAHGGDGSPPRVEPMMAASEPSPMGARIRLLKRSVMNSRLPKRMVSPREKSSLDRHSPPVAMMSADDGTIGTSGEKAHCKSRFLACQLSFFSAPTKYRLVKIVCSSSEMVLHTIKHTMIYPGSDFSLEVIVLCPVV
jgi:hypothetical protein